MIARTTRRVAAKFGSSLPRSSLKFLRQELERLLEKVQKRSERIADLEKELADAQKKIAEQEKQITEQEKQITEQEKQITDLERQLALRKRNSTNSSKPPSSDGLAGEQRPRGRKHKSQRKPGGQPGHRASSPPDSHGRGERPKSAAAGTLPALRAKAAAKGRPSDNGGGATTASGDGDSGD